MSKPRKSYTKAEKLEVVKMSLEDSQPIKELAERFEVSENTIHNWRKIYLKNKNASFSGKGNQTMAVEQRKIKALEKRLKEMKLE